MEADGDHHLKRTAKKNPTYVHSASVVSECLNIQFVSNLQFDNPVFPDKTSASALEVMIALLALAS